jgi:NAD(P)-dependent dehydrogenase (short-subunit alcohol dehydrogenase family)
MSGRSSGNISGMRNAAMAHFSKTLADQLGPFGINVTCIHPGTTLTERSMPMYREQAEREGISTEAVVERVSKGIGIRKIVEAKELAYLAAFLASPRSVAVNGEVISAGGGTVGVFYQ